MREQGSVVTTRWNGGGDERTISASEFPVFSRAHGQDEPWRKRQEQNGDRSWRPHPMPRCRIDVTPFIGPGLMRVGGCGHAAAPC